MNIFQKIHYIKSLKNNYVSTHKINNELADSEKQVADYLVTRIMNHFYAYNQDRQDFGKITSLSECENVLKGLLLHLKYYKLDEKAIKEEHENLRKIVNKKEENYKKYLEITKQLQSFKQTKFLTRFYNKNKNLCEIEKGRELSKKAEIYHDDAKNYIMQAIYSKVLVIEPIEYEYLEKIKKYLQELRGKFLATDEQNSTKDNAKDNVMEQ